MSKAKACRAKFDKIKALNADIDGDCKDAKGGARKAKSKMNDAWFNRSAGSTKGFFDQKKAREIKRGAV